MTKELVSQLSRPIRIVAIGDELMRGDHPDTNSPWLAERLAQLGKIPDSIEQLPDRDDAAETAVRRWTQEGGTLFLGGGLGPTEDDATRDEIAAGLGVKLILNEEAARMICDLEVRRGRTFTSYTHRQANLPEGCRPVQNPVGTAPSIFCGVDIAFIVIVLIEPGDHNSIRQRVQPVP
ncbi:hypothetical protein H8E52_12765, partial [bacterium]|nr:hypothetical protein [bacterium]